MNKRSRILVPALLWLGALPIALAGSPPCRATDGEATFREVASILTGKCLTCHGPDKKKGALDLSRRSAALGGGESGPAFVAGKPGDSVLYRRLVAGEMPPSGPLKLEQVA